MKEAKGATNAYYDTADDGNYASYDDHKQAADELLQEEYRQGRILWRKTRAELCKLRGGFTHNRIGVIAKLKDGKTKYRLVHDLRRSGVNSKVTTHERVILPRANDAKDDILGLADSVEHSAGKCLCWTFNMH